LQRADKGARMEDSAPVMCVIGGGALI